MSRVTIGELIEDVVPFTEESDKIIPIEIAPRKIIEDIIEICGKHMKETEKFADSNHPFSCGMNAMACKIKKFAEGQLRMFEEDNNDGNNQ